MVSIAKQALLVSALTLSACSTTQTVSLTVDEAPILVNTKWRELSPSRVTLSFRFTPRNKNGQPIHPGYNSPEGFYYMWGMGGCNGAGAGYLQKNWSLVSTGETPSTVMGCSNERVAEDVRLANALAKVQTFSITENDQLILFDEKKQKLLVLNRDTHKTP